MFRTSSKVCTLLLIALFWCGEAFAAAPMWMPGFPMRMATNVMLMWAPIPGATAYNIYRSDKKGELGALLMAAPMNNHMDVNVPLTQTYYYTIRAVAGGAEGEPSSQGEIVGAKPLDPPEMGGLLFQDGTLNMRWSGVSGAAFYNLYKSEKKEGPFNLVGSVQDVRFGDTAVEEGKTYYYQVSGVDKLNVEGPKSKVAEYEIKKVVKAAPKKQWKKVEKQVKFVDFFYGPDEAPLQNPGLMTIGPDGATIWYIDQGLKAMSLEGEFMGEVVMPDNYKGDWGKANGLSVGKDGDLVTSWAGYQGVRIINGQGDIVTEFKVNFPDEEEYKKLGREKDWEEDKTIRPYLSAVAVDGAGRIWVSETRFKQVYIFGPDGTFIKKLGDPNPRGLGGYGMAHISKMVYHKGSNRIYGVNPSSQMVYVFDAKTMDFITDEKGEKNYGFRMAGADPGYFQQPLGLAFRGDEIWMNDTIDGRIQVFSLNFDYLYQAVTEPGTNAPPETGNGLDLLIINDKLYLSQNLAGKIAIFDIK